VSASTATRKVALSHAVNRLRAMVRAARRAANLDDRIGGFRPAAAAKYADALRKAGLPD